MTTTGGNQRLASEIALAICTDCELSVQMGGTTPPNQDKLIDYVTGVVKGILDGMQEGGEDFIEREIRTR